MKKIQILLFILFFHTVGAQCIAPAMHHSQNIDIQSQNIAPAIPQSQNIDIQSQIAPVMHHSQNPDIQSQNNDIQSQNIDTQSQNNDILAQNNAFQRQNFVTIASRAQNIAPLQTVNTPIAVLRGDYGGTASQKFYIGVYRGTGFQFVDSVLVSDTGTLTVPLRDDYRGVIIVACGDYESSWQETFLHANPETSLQFIFDGQDIEYKTSWRNQSYPKYLQYIQGCEATAALKELHTKLSDSQERMWYIEKLMEKTPEKSKFYSSLQKEFAQTVKTFNQYCDSVSGNFQGQAFMQLYSRMFKRTVPPAKLNAGQRSEWSAQHLFDYCDLQDPMTADVPLFQSMIRHYLYLHKPVGMSPAQEIEQTQQAALEQLQARCNFQLPVPSDRYQ